MPAPARGATGRRLYGEADLAVIRRMASLVETGLGAAAAAAAVHGEEEVSSPRLVTGPAEQLDARISALLDCTESFDQTLLMDMLGTAERSMGVEAALEHIALPALVEAGQRWESGHFTVAQEHLLAETIRSWMTGHSRLVPVPGREPGRILVACPEDERHELGALGLALVLRRAGLNVAYLGADVPTYALVDAARLVRFDALCLVATVSASLPTARLAIAALHSMGSRTRLYVGGRAATQAPSGATDSIAAVRLPGSLTAAATLIVTQLGGSAATGGT